MQNNQKSPQMILVSIYETTVAEKDSIIDVGIIYLCINSVLDYS